MSTNPSYDLPSIDIRIDVTRMDIEAGHRGSASRCAIALAVKYALRSMGDVSVQVGNGMILIDNWSRGNHVQYVAAIDDRAGMFIQHFDKGRHVEPFSMNITLRKQGEVVRMSPISQFPPMKMGIDWVHSPVFKPSKKQELFLLGV